MLPSQERVPNSQRYLAAQGDERVLFGLDTEFVEISGQRNIPVSSDDLPALSLLESDPRLVRSPEPSDSEVLHSSFYLILRLLRAHPAGEAESIPNDLSRSGK